MTSFGCPWCDHAVDLSVDWFSMDAATCPACQTRVEFGAAPPLVRSTQVVDGELPVAA